MNPTPTMPAEEEVHFDTLLKMDPRQVSIEIWGERLVDTYNARCKGEPKRRRDWRPLVNFIMAVDAFYPTMSAVLYARLEKLERKQANKKRDWPRKSSFECLVNFGVEMISLLAEGRREMVTENYPTAAGGGHDSLMGTAAEIVGHEQEPQEEWERGHGPSLRDEASLVGKRKRDEDPQVEATAPMPRKRVKFDLAPPEDATTARLDKLVIPGVPHANDEDGEDDEDGGMIIMSGGLRAKGPDTYQREPSPEGNDTSTADDSQSEESHRLDSLERTSSVASTRQFSENNTKDSRVMANAERDGRCRICGSLGHDTAACGPGQSERRDGRECLSTTAADRARREETTQGALAGTMEPPAPVRKSDRAQALTSSTSSTSTMANPLPAKPQGVNHVEAEGIQCFICDEKGHISDDCQFFRVCQRGSKASLDFSERIRLRDRVLMHAKDPDGKIHVERCYICDPRNHATQDCRFLWLYRKHGDSVVGMGPRNKKRCRAWVLNQKPAERVPRDQCYICGATAHATDECGFLEAYRAQGAVSLGGIPGVFVDRCRFWLLEEENPVIMKSTGDGCDICSESIHATENCKFLEFYRADKTCSSVPSVYKTRCKAYTRYTRAPDSVEDKQDDIKKIGSEVIGNVAGRVVTKFVTKFVKDNGAAVVKENGTAIVKENGTAIAKGKGAAVAKKKGATAANGKGRAVIERETESAIVKKGSQTIGATEKKKSSLSPTVCTICNSKVHLEDSCPTLKHFRKHGSVPYAHDKYCRKWMSEEARVGWAGIDDPSSSDAASCKICCRKGHFTKSCRILKDYRIYGDQAPRAKGAIIGRCKKWIGEEMRKVRAALAGV